MITKINTHLSHASLHNCSDQAFFAHIAWRASTSEIVELVISDGDMYLLRGVVNIANILFTVLKHATD